MSSRQVSFTVETSKFRQLVSQFLLYDGTPGLESVVLEVEPQKLTVQNSSLNIAGVYSVVASRFFKEYEVKEPTDVVITASFYNKLSKLLRKSDTIEVTVSDKIRVVGNNEGFEEDLLNLEKIPFFTEVVPEPLENEKALFPKDAVKNAQVVVRMDLEDFTSIPASEKFRLSSVDSKIRVDVEEEKYWSILEPKSVVKNSDVSAEFNMEYFGRLIRNIPTEDVWLLLNKGALAFSKVTPEHAYLLLMTCNEE